MTSKRARIIPVLLSVLLLAAAVCVWPATAAGETCSDLLDTDSVNSQDYFTYASPVQNYLVPAADGWMRVVGGSEPYVEYYSADFRLISKRTIAQELPVFGGFYAVDDCYFLLTGQNNPKESNKTEVFRITKYDRNWTRLGSAGLKGANTTVPFDAGSARFAVCGDYLLVRTCHEMYTSSDGRNHQANVTMELNYKTMQMTDAYFDVMNISCGYVSHSFNQFIRVENNRIIAVDHGDAYPRAVALCKYNTDCSDGTFTDGYGFCDGYSLKTFDGAVGDNFTGASVGGFEVSSKNYLVAGNSLARTGAKLKTRNIFLSVMNKNTERITNKWITAYPEGSESAGTPHLVSIGGDRFMLLWSRGESVCYVVLDGEGKTVGATLEMPGALSDCVPVLKDGTLVWYTNTDDTITFYRIPVVSPDAADATTVHIGHRWKAASVQKSGKASFTCEKCGATQSAVVPTALELYWGGADDFSYWSYCDTEPKEGTDIYYWIFPSADAGEVSDAYDAVEVTSSNENVVRVDTKNGGLLFQNAGTATVTFRAVYHPSVKVNITFEVQHAFAQSETRKATMTNDGAVIAKCSLCGKTVSQPIAHPAAFKLSKTKYSCTGEEHQPTVTVLDRNGNIIDDGNYTVTYKNNTAIGKASAVVSMRGNYTGQKVLTFKIVPLKIKGVKAKSNAKKQVTVSFPAQSGVQKYQIYYSEQKSGPYQKLADTKKTAYTAKKLVSGRKYYFKVRACSVIDGTRYYGAFSAVKGAKVK